MSYSISYSAKTFVRDRWHQTEKSKTPYGDWISRGQLDAIFKYCNHCGDDIISIHFHPLESLLHISGNFDYYNFDLVTELLVNSDAHTISIKKLFCKNENMWPEVMGGPVTGEGGLSCYKKNLEYSSVFSLETAILCFFGLGWKLLPLPMTVPRVDDEVFDKGKGFGKDFEFYRRGPWGRTTGLFKVNRKAASIIIQKYFRGWKARMAYTFNPHTTLGAYYLKRSYDKLIDE